MGWKRSISIPPQQRQRSPRRVFFHIFPWQLGRARERHCNVSKTLPKQTLIWNYRPCNTRLLEHVRSYSKTTFGLHPWVFGPSCCDHLCQILSQEPDPKKIRPYSVLRETVDQLKNRWKQKENYNWICSQFKSVRQDLTVSSLLPIVNEHS